MGERRDRVLPDEVDFNGGIGRGGPVKRATRKPTKGKPIVTMPDIPAEAVEAAEKALWVKMIVDGSPSIGLDVSAALAAALPHLRERWLAEVEGALRDQRRFGEWYRQARGRSFDPTTPMFIEYLRDVLGEGK